MDIRKQKKIGCAIISLFIIMCLSCISAVSFITSSKSANAIKDLSQTTNIGNLLLDDYVTRSDGKVFNRDQLNKLYSQITGIENATYDNVKELAEGTLNSDYFRTKNSGKDITVTLNRMVWNVTYLSTNRQKEPIVTLWLASSSDKAEWNLYSDDTDGAYPANMYGTSMMRALTLNNGGTYYTSNSGSGEQTIAQDPENKYAKFTMEGVEGSLTSFIDTPSNVEWQATVSARDNNAYNYNFNNDAYSTTMGDFYDSHDYQSKTGYSDWKEDKIWLPAMAETGWQQDCLGLWKTNVNQQGNAGEAISWTRSGASINYFNTLVLSADGFWLPYGSATDSFAVRPAFHLNLKAADTRAGLAEPTDITTEYTGETLTLADVSAEQKGWYNADKIDLE
ncbi:MAG: hypothetical protein K2I78_04670, partial [Clostridia bacterium]|nr:hypothetical protein [Clostridia bacterium]